MGPLWLCGPGLARPICRWRTALPCFASSPLALGQRNRGGFSIAAVDQRSGGNSTMKTLSLPLWAAGLRLSTWEKWTCRRRCHCLRKARCVAGVHGSNLTNIAFCQPGTAVVEIAAGLPQPHFERLAEAAALRFMRVEADPVAPDSKDKTWAQAHGDLTVDPAAVLTVIDEVLAGP